MISQTSYHPIQSYIRGNGCGFPFGEIYHRDSVSPNMTALSVDGQQEQISDMACIMPSIDTMHHSSIYLW